jgi:hypothetical protein
MFWNISMFILEYVFTFQNIPVCIHYYFAGPGSDDDDETVELAPKLKNGDLCTLRIDVVRDSTRGHLSIAQGYIIDCEPDPGEFMEDKESLYFDPKFWYELRITEVIKVQKKSGRAAASQHMLSSDQVYSTSPEYPLTPEDRTANGLKKLDSFIMWAPWVVPRISAVSRR